MNLRHKLLGMTLATALTLGVGTAKADTVVPLVTPNTTITLTNATGKTVSGNAIFNGTGSDGTGTETVPYSIPAFSEMNVTNPVTIGPNLGHYPNGKIVPDIDSSTGTQYVDPITHVFDCDNGNGHNVPTWNSVERQNTQPLAGTLQTGTEVLTVASGNQPCTFSVTYYSPIGEGPFYSAPIHFGPNGSTTYHINDLTNGVLPSNSSIEVHFDGPSQANGRAALVYTDPASLDTRVTEMKKYTPVQQPADAVAKAYVQKWLIPGGTGFFLFNQEIRAMINGDSRGTPSYVNDMATILVNSSGAGGKTLDQMVQWLKNEADCNLSNGDLCHAISPFNWNDGSLETVGVIMYDEPWPTPGTLLFPLGPTDVQSMYSLVKDQFLWRYVMNNPELYGGSAGGLPDTNHNPNWGVGGLDSFNCP